MESLNSEPSRVQTNFYRKLFLFTDPTSIKMLKLKSFSCNSTSKIQRLKHSKRIDLRINY